MIYYPVDLKRGTWAARATVNYIATDRDEGLDLCWNVSYMFKVFQAEVHLMGIGLKLTVQIPTK